MLELSYRNAPASRCSHMVLGRGERIASYQGGPYAIIGLYLARGPNGRRELFFILRSLNGNGRWPPLSVHS